jgi:arylsulfatase A-like enzyme
MRDKPSVLSRARVDDAAIQTLFTARIESLAAVDDAVAATFRALEDTGELENTIVVFTSDNGFLLGEHRHVGKSVAYEQSLRVPFLVAAPTLAAGTATSRTVSLVDLAATLVEAAGATAARRLDGASFLHATPDDTARRTLLVQAGNGGARRGGREWDYRGIRAPRYTYLKWYTGERELYDRRIDPHQLVNRADRGRYRDVLAWARRVSRRLEQCSGASCRREPSAPPRVR